MFWGSWGSPSGRPLDFHEIYSYSIHCLRGCSQQESSRRPTKAYPTSPKDNSLILHSPALTTEAEAEPSQETRGDILAHKAWQSSAWRTQRPLILPLRRGLSEYQRLLGPSFTHHCGTSYPLADKDSLSQGGSSEGKQQRIYTRLCCCCSVPMHILVSLLCGHT